MPVEDLLPGVSRTRQRGRVGALDGIVPAEADLAVGGAHRLQLARFRGTVNAVRGVTTVVSLVLVVLAGSGQADGVYVWVGVLVGYNAFRLWVPLQGDEDTVDIVKLLVEVALVTVAVAFSGAWASPFVFLVLPAIIVAGFGRGIVAALRVGLVMAVTISAVELATVPVTGEVWVSNVQWTLFIALVGVMAGYARRILGEARTTHSAAMSRVENLTDANRLLTSLHAVTQALPASLDLEEVLDSTVVRLRTLFTYDAAVILLWDATDGSWRVARWDGHRLDPTLEPTQLPGVLHRVHQDRSVRRVQELTSRARGGLVPKMESGLYGAMLARGEFIGIVALEAEAVDHFADSDVDLLRGFLEPASLAVANAQVFERLRRVGADEERTRIARDLHDRIGQSLAYVAFELDRLVRRHDQGGDVGTSLSELRNDVRGVIGEVRDTLYDLRTDVSEEQDFVTTMESFLERVEQRSGMAVALRAEVTGRLPLLPERELWRIAQEAVINVERHARADHVLVRWRTDGSSAQLEIVDDGAGLAEGRAGRLDSYGILGMRERAASIGATLQITGSSGRGTVVRCRMDAG